MGRIRQAFFTDLVTSVAAVAITGSVVKKIDTKIETEIERRQETFKQMLKKEFGLNYRELEHFLFSLPYEEFQAVYSELEKLSKSTSFREEIEEVMHQVNVPGNSTKQRLSSVVITRIGPEKRKIFVSIYETHKQEIQDLFHVQETIERKDFMDYLDYYRKQGNEIDKEQIVRFAKIAEVTLTEEEIDQIFLNRY